MQNNNKAVKTCLRDIVENHLKTLVLKKNPN